MLDYAELVHRCRILLTRPDIVTTLRREIGWSSWTSIKTPTPPRCGCCRSSRVTAGMSSSWGSRPVDLCLSRRRARGDLGLPERFRTREGAPAPVLALNRTRRFGSVLLAASRNVVSRLGIPRSLPAEVFQAFRYPTADPQIPKGKVEVFTCSSGGAEAEHIAEILRSAHLRENLAWTDMAVLVRAGRTMIPGLTRALVAAGVPVEVAGDEIPLAADPAVRPLLLALQVAARGCAPPARRHSCCSPHPRWAWTACHAPTGTRPQRR